MRGGPDAALHETVISYPATRNANRVPGPAVQLNGRVCISLGEMRVKFRRASL